MSQAQARREAERVQTVAGAEKHRRCYRRHEAAVGEEWVRKIEAENADDLTPEKIARMEKEAAARNTSRRTEEARQATDILGRLEMLGKTQSASQ